MKIIPLLRKLESVKTMVKSKKQFHQEISKGDLVSIIYYDLEKEHVKLQQFTGICTKFKSKGFNTKIIQKHPLVTGQLPSQRVYNKQII